MDKMFSSQEKIGDIVARFPVAATIFKRFHIDFCCGGSRTLKEALNEQRIEEASLLESVEEAYRSFLKSDSGEVDWRQSDYSSFIDYIISKHHDYMYKELPVIGELIKKLLRAHGEAHGEELSAVHRLYSKLRGELEQHLISEEVSVFPAVKEHERTHSEAALEKALKGIEALEDEHEGVGSLLKELRKVTDHYKVPDDGCITYSYTYRKLEELEEDIFKHVHLENNILFPRLRGKI